MRVVVLTACATVLAAPHAMAADTTPTGTNPAEQLWRAYPLEQTATTSGQPAVPPTRSTTGGSPKTSGRAAGDDTPWLALVLAAAGIGIVAALAVVGARRRSRRPRPSPAVVSTPRAAAAAVEDSAPRAAAAEPAAGASGANGDTAARPPSAPEAEPVAIPAPPSDPPAAPPPAQTRRPSPSRKEGRTAPRGKNAAAAKSPSANSGGRDPAGTGKPARGPICQIRWLPKGRGSCFAAVMADADGVERTLATSPTVQWRAATPPEQSPEAQAALRQLSKTLRDGGWRAMRTKGKDFNEPQWYARRFRLQVPAADGPTAGEDPGASTTGPPRAASGRTRQAASRPR